MSVTPGHGDSRRSDTRRPKPSSRTARRVLVSIVVAVVIVIVVPAAVFGPDAARHDQPAPRRPTVESVGNPAWQPVERAWRWWHRNTERR
ncbi:hypothetical protein ACFRCG_35055 [Embleya sp. NPDC056575]|uniref:hypothetical protein n=1 Tax=unclassified Embleya TaxID=2699296 RepID=UPI00369F15E1